MLLLKISLLEPIEKAFYNKRTLKKNNEKVEDWKKFLRKKTEEIRKLYVKQRNKWVSLLEKAKKQYYQHLDEKNVTDNKKFWKTVKPLLSDKPVSTEKINLTENEKLLTSQSDTAETLNFLSNVAKKPKAYARYFYQIFIFFIK